MIFSNLLIMDKNTIVKTLLFYDRFFPFIKGDICRRQELAEKAAEEMLNYKYHDLWEDVEILSKKLPNTKNYEKDS